MWLNAGPILGSAVLVPLSPEAETIALALVS
jgi:hypothetical protein